MLWSATSVVWSAIWNLEVWRVAVDSTAGKASKRLISGMMCVLTTQVHKNTFEWMMEFPHVVGACIGKMYMDTSFISSVEAKKKLIKVKQVI